MEKKIAEPLSSLPAASSFNDVPSQHLSSLTLSAQHFSQAKANSKKN